MSWASGGMRSEKWAVAVGPLRQSCLPLPRLGVRCRPPRAPPPRKHGPQEGRKAGQNTFRSAVTDLVFFYGTLMRPFNKAGRLRVSDHLFYVGRGTISAALFDLGIYPAAVPASDGQVWGEVYQMTHPRIVLQVLDEFEGCRTDEPETSLYTRAMAPVALPDGRIEDAWVYFYNAPLGRAERIQSGDYLQHLNLR